MGKELTFDENENAWLLILPEVWSGGRFFPSCTIVAIRTLKDTYFPSTVTPGEKQVLTGRTYTLALYWDGGGWHQEPKYVAEFSQNIWNGETKVNLTKDDFLVDYKLRGRGLGTWIMQQIICWARTLPADTPVVPVKTSPVDEDDKENMQRRDHFWHGIGFRFRKSERQSQPISVRDLQLPKGSKTTLRAIPIHKGVEELARTCDKQRQEIDALKSARLSLSEDNRRLQARQWDTLLITIILSPFLLAFWLWKQLTGQKEKS